MTCWLKGIYKPSEILYTKGTKGRCEPMKLRVERCDGDGEVVIYCDGENDTVRRVRAAVERILSEEGETVLTLGDTEYYVPKRDLIFFETDDGKVTAHTRDRMYYTGMTLQSLEKTLPHCFVRASKSCIVNVYAVCALSKNITGIGEVLFRGTDKKVYVSRGYYKDLKQKLYELRALEK